MQNVELKCELLDPAAAREVCRRLGARRVGLLEQRDTYFEVEEGRLKRRECVGRADEWIFYRRPDRNEARLSEYEVLDRASADARFGLDRLRAWSVVEKRRDLWLVGATRIHLDDVKDLGWFFELEAVVGSAQDVNAARRAVADIQAAFAHVLGNPVATSYSDLVASAA